MSFEDLTPADITLVEATSITSLPTPDDSDGDFSDDISIETNTRNCDLFVRDAEFSFFARISLPDGTLLDNDDNNYVTRIDGNRLIIVKEATSCITKKVVLKIDGLNTPDTENAGNADDTASARSSESDRESNSEDETSMSTDGGQEILASDEDAALFAHILADRYSGRKSSDYGRDDIDYAETIDHYFYVREFDIEPAAPELARHLFEIATPAHHANPVGSRRVQVCFDPDLPAHEAVNIVEYVDTLGYGIVGQGTGRNWSYLTIEQAPDLHKLSSDLGDAGADAAPILDYLFTQAIGSPDEQASGGLPLTQTAWGNMRGAKQQAISQNVGRAEDAIAETQPVEGTTSWLRDNPVPVQYTSETEAGDQN